MIWYIIAPADRTQQNEGIMWRLSLRKSFDLPVFVLPARSERFVKDKADCCLTKIIRVVFLIFIASILKCGDAASAQDMLAPAVTQPAALPAIKLPARPKMPLRSTKHPQKNTKKMMEAEVDYWIDPDRPHLADAAVNVPRGLCLVENGFQETFLNKKTSVFDFPETLFRIGIADRTELRFDSPNIELTRTANNGLRESLSAEDETIRAAGVENMQFGFKHRLGPLGPTKFQIAVNPFISIPSGFGGNVSRRVDPFIRFPFAQEINKDWEIKGMESFLLPTEDGRYNLDWENDIVINRYWGRQKNAFIEYSGDKFARGPMINIIQFGAAYRPDRRQQIDMQFGFRLNNAAPIAFLGFGYSFLLGNLNTEKLTPSRFKK